MERGDVNEPAPYEKNSVVVPSLFFIYKIASFAVVWRHDATARVPCQANGGPLREKMVMCTAFEMLYQEQK